MRALLIIIAATLAACQQQQIVPFNPEPPRAALMKAPETLPPMKAGDDMYDVALQARAAHGREADKVRGLQGYIRTLLKRRKEAAHQ